VQVNPVKKLSGKIFPFCHTLTFNVVDVLPLVRVVPAGASISTEYGSLISANDIISATDVFLVPLEGSVSVIIHL
jgi:hypothetical protein